MRSSEKRQTPAEPYYFPAEIWREILARLPVKSVLRFRCISKSFRDIVDDDPNFIAMHLNFYKNNRHKTQLLTQERRMFNQETFTIRHSDTFTECMTDQPLDIIILYQFYNGVNGLILMKEVGTSKLRLCNPSIRKSLLLPLIPYPYNTDSYAVGYISSTNNYKVVAFPHPNHHRVAKLSIAVYDVVKDGFWRIKTDFKDLLTSWSRLDFWGTFVYSKGALYKLVRDTDRSSRWNEHTHMLSLDCETEEFSLVELPNPDEDDDWKMRWYFFAHSESVGVFGISAVKSCIWVLGKDREKMPWIKLYSGNSSPKLYGSFRSDICGYFIYIEESGKFFVQDSGGVKSYDIRSHQFKDLVDRQYVAHIDTYVESLVLSKGLEGQTRSFP